ncbi:ABC transporter substrate-binding protein [Corynebacterium bovis]|uniref:ABC transporter substrate-binding protein n=1 Tax=Corynebacterium bovis TaxID=36808 RepID=UPI0024492E50|nr:ABC transporter substrate-binding protein [Corynebacterium bovis]MDH2456606.1 ABC transporter substrate-binding protein [Corynebacterium bovis]
MKKTITAAVLAAAVTVPLAACSTDDATTDAHQISVENCGDTVTFDHTPQRVTLMKPASVPTLHRLGVMDTVVARAGVYPDEYFDDATRAELAKVPSITDKLNPSGHVQVSKEEVVQTDPDLVIGESDTITRQALADTGIRLVEEPGFCGAITGDARFDDIYDQVRTYGTIFGKSDEADAYVSELRSRVDDMRARATEAGKKAEQALGHQLSVAVLYPSVGGGTTYAYGRSSMSHPLVEAAGLKNVFGDQQKRVFEVNTEEVVDRNPDIIISLYSQGSPADVEKAIADLPGAGDITAVKEHRILPMLINFAEPPTPLAVDGLEKVTKEVSDITAAATAGGAAGASSASATASTSASAAASTSETATESAVPAR